MAWCYAIDRRRLESMDCQAPKEYFFPARFGWRIVGTCSAAKKKRANYSSACSTCATISDFFRKSTIHAANVSWEIFLKLSRTWRWLAAPEFSPMRRRWRVEND